MWKLCFAVTLLPAEMFGPGVIAMQKERGVSQQGKWWWWLGGGEGNTHPQHALAWLPVRRWLSSCLLCSSLFSACAPAGGWAGGRSVHSRLGAKCISFGLFFLILLCSSGQKHMQRNAWHRQHCMSLAFEVCFPPVGIYVGLTAVC